MPNVTGCSIVFRGAPTSAPHAATASIASTACSTPVATMRGGLAQVRTAFANILAVTAKAAELDICQIGYLTFGRSVRQAFGRGGHDDGTRHRGSAP